MLRKTMLLALAVGALVAFAAPAVAGAQQLYDKAGVLKVGAEVTATSTNTTMSTAVGVIDCEHITIHATVTANGPTTSALDAPITSITTTNCKLNQTGLGGGHVPMPITEHKTTASFHITEGGVGTSSLTYVSDFNPPTGPECGFAGTPGVTYVTDSDVIHVEGNLVADPLKAGCFPTGVIAGDFTLETENGDTVFIE